MNLSIKAWLAAIENGKQNRARAESMRRLAEAVEGDSLRARLEKDLLRSHSEELGEASDHVADKSKSALVEEAD